MTYEKTTARTGPSSHRRELASNRRAFHEYHIHDRFEAGIELLGTEVKAARCGKIQLQDGFVEVRNGQAFLAGVHIGAYSHGNRENHAPVRPRKLLLHRREIDKLQGRSQGKGFSIVPLQVYLKGDRIKAEIALVQGKKLYDKRATERERELDATARAAVKELRGREA
jgi:SsrA-binding protein